MILNFDLDPKLLEQNRHLVLKLVDEMKRDRNRRLVLKIDRWLRQVRMKELIIFREEYNRVRTRNSRRWR